MTIFLIVSNVCVYILQLTYPEDGRNLVFAYGAIPHNLMAHDGIQPISPYATVITSMFMHGGLLHLTGNMLYLWIFGDNIEDSLGHARYVFFYLFCGIAAAYSHALINPDSTIPMIGASGAISGVLGAYALLFPAAKVYTILFFGFFVEVVRVPALIVIGIWAIIQVVQGSLSKGVLDHGGIAWMAHAGGFLAGLFTIRVWLPRRF